MNAQRRGFVYYSEDYCSSESSLVLFSPVTPIISSACSAVILLLFIITLILGCIAFYLTRDKDEIAKKKQRKKIAKQKAMESRQLGGF